MMGIEIISASLGVIVGLILALTGAGGATLTIPLLVLVFNLSIFQAAPIALLAVFTAASISTIQGLRKGIVRYKSALLIATIGMLLAPLGVKLAQNTPNQLLTIGLIFTLFYIGVRSWQLANQHAIDNSHLAPPACMINPATSKLFWTAACTKRLIGTGIISGFLSGLLGVGGGFVIAPSLNKVSNFNPATVVATTLAAVALISASSIASHWQTSAINWQIAIPFVIGVNFAMLLTTEMLSEKISKQTSQKGFAVVCIIAAMYLIVKNMT
jgi:uncharacterized protein